MQLEPRCPIHTEAAQARSPLTTVLSGADPTASRAAVGRRLLVWKACGRPALRRDAR